MTIEQRLQAMLGQQSFVIVVLETHLEQAKARIAELEAACLAKPAPDAAR